MIVNTTDYKPVKDFAINQQLPFGGTTSWLINNVSSGTFNIMVLKINVAAWFFAKIRRK